MQAISKSNTNFNTNFCGKVINVGEFCEKTTYAIDKIRPKLQKMIKNKPFNLYINEDMYSGNSISISAQKAEDFAESNKKYIKAFVSSRGKNPELMCLDAAKYTVKTYQKQYMPIKNIFTYLLKSITKAFI